MQLKRQGEYRTKLRQKMGDEEYKKEQAQKKRDYRLKKKLQMEQDDVIKQEMQQNKNKGKKNMFVENIVSKIMKTIEEKKHQDKGRYPCETTVRTQLNRVRLLYKYIYDKEMETEDWEWLTDVKKISKFIEENKEWKTLNSKNAIYGSIASVLKYMDGMMEYQKKYSEIVTEKTKEIEIEYGDNMMSDNVKKNYVKWEDILEVWDSLETSRDKLLYSLYVDIPPRRIMDYANMKFITEEQKTKMDEKYNYIVVSHGKISEIIFNSYKTSKTYGQQKLCHIEWINMGRLEQAFNDYIHQENKNENVLLFGRKKLDDEIALLFKGKFEEKRVSVNVLRHSYITYILKKEVNMSVNRRKEIAYIMGNSLNSQNNYFYLDG